MGFALSQLIPEPVRLLAPDTPILYLQGAALVGLLAAVLLMARRMGWPIRRRSLIMGGAVGVTGYIVGALAPSMGARVASPTLVIDFLFLGAFLGGVRGGLLSFVLVELARWQFGTIHHLGASLVDGLIYLFAGWGMRLALGPLPLQPLRWRTVWLVWGTRASATVLGTMSGGLVSQQSIADLIHVWHLRASVLPASWLVIYCVLLLMANDAEIDAQLAREQALLRRDALSGLPNRRALSEFIQAYWLKPVSRPACLLVLELANLRDFLARYGHEQACLLWQAGGLESGGVLLRELLQGLRAHTPQAFQYSDFSLALFLDAASLAELARQRTLESVLLRCELRLAEAWPGFRPAIRCAVVDLVEAPAGSAPSVPYRDVTMALNSLQSGVAYFDGLMRHDKALDHFIETQMALWVDPRRMPLWLQPKLNLFNGQVSGAEALLRLSDAGGRAIAPMRVISALRRCGRLAEFEWLALAAVVHLLQRFQSALPGVSLSVNVSAESLRQKGFAEAVHGLLSECRVAAGLLRLELVEWTELIHDATVRTNLEHLCSLGVPLSIDDFGSGYSNLLLLTRFAVSEVKIDQSLVNSLDELKSLAVVEHIVELAHRCQATVVAEGLETQNLASQVRALGADMGQGFLYSQALPPEEFVAYCLQPRSAQPA